MKKRNNIYYILTYLFFLYPPFLMGITSIYSIHSSSIYINSFVINVILVLSIVFFLAYLVYRKKLHVPDKDEVKHLFFGLICNVIVYFYTFQYYLNIENYVTTYLALLLVLIFYTLLITKKIGNKELWLFSILFLVFDNLHFMMTGCSYNESYQCYNTPITFGINILYVIIPLIIVAWYIYKIFLYKLLDFFKLANILMIAVLSIMIQFPNYSSKIILTLSIVIPFLTIIDFIVAKINKTYNKYSLLFYIRTYALLIVFVVYGLTNYFRFNELSFSSLSVMVIIIYASLILSILEYIFKINESYKISGIEKKRLLSDTTEFIQYKVKTVLSRYEYSLYVSFEGMENLEFLSRCSKHVFSFNMIANDKEQTIVKKQNISHVNLEQELYEEIVVHTNQNIKVVMIDVNTNNILEKLEKTIVGLIEKSIELLLDDGLIVINVINEDIDLEKYLKDTLSSKYTVLVYKILSSENNHTSILIEQK